MAPQATTTLTAIPPAPSSRSGEHPHTKITIELTAAELYAVDWLAVGLYDDNLGDDALGRVCKKIRHAKYEAAAALIANFSREEFAR